uniref:Uncharacterized protein n=1 Tax=Oryza rufipogon TaxID=4529 RepID=A0A0E0R0R5_ORYRU
MATGIHNRDPLLPSSFDRDGTRAASVVVATGGLNQPPAPYVRGLGRHSHGSGARWPLAPAGSPPSAAPSPRRSPSFSLPPLVVAPGERRFEMCDDFMILVRLV